MKGLEFKCFPSEEKREALARKEKERRRKWVDKVRKEFKDGKYDKFIN